MRKPRRREVQAAINVTPLVDVVLVLLIIFMVVTPMIAGGIAIRPVKPAWAKFQWPGEKAAE